MDKLRLRNEAVRWRELEGELVAIDLDTSVYLGANETGLLLWRALAEGTSRDRLVDELVRSFGIDTARAAPDVDAFLAAVRECGLLVS